MRAAATLCLAVLMSACGDHPPPSGSWRVALRYPDGRGMYLPELIVVRFAPGAEPQEVRTGTGDPGREFVDLPELTSGHYEVWVPGCRPLRVDRAPTEPLTLQRGYEVRVEWRADAPVEEGNAVHVKATWRGPGDHPEALIRTAYPAAAPAPGEHSWNYVGFVEGILITPPERVARLYVPWPGRYRLKWGTGAYRISEGPGHFSGSGGGSWSPEDTLSVEVLADSAPPTVTIPPR